MALDTRTLVRFTCDATWHGFPLSDAQKQEIALAISRLVSDNYGAVEASTTHDFTRTAQSAGRGGLSKRLGRLDPQVRARIAGQLGIASAEPVKMAEYLRTYGLTWEDLQARYPDLLA